MTISASSAPAEAKDTHAPAGFLRPAPQSVMPAWQDKLFIWLARSANDASQYFGIPSGRAVEVGTQVTV